MTVVQIKMGLIEAVHWTGIGQVRQILEWQVILWISWTSMDFGMEISRAWKIAGARGTFVARPLYPRDGVMVELIVLALQIRFDIKQAWPAWGFPKLSVGRL